MIIAPVGFNTRWSSKRRIAIIERQASYRSHLESHAWRDLRLVLVESGEHVGTAEPSRRFSILVVSDNYQHCGEKHLRRCLAEFDFQYCSREANSFNDAQRSLEALRGIAGKRRTYPSSPLAA